MFWLSFGLLAVAGVFFSVAMALSQTLLQILARNEMCGRVTSAYQTAFGLMPLGAVPMGIALTGSARPSGWGAS